MLARLSRPLPRQAAVRTVTPLPPLPRRALRLFTLQLQVMLNAGIPCVRALEALSRGGEPQVCRVAADLCHTVEKGGCPLSKAMSRMPRVFAADYVLMVRLGEDSGRLPHVLGLLAGWLHQQDDRHSRLVAALTYPACILLSCLLMAAFLVYFMLPGYLTLLNGGGAELPGLTRLLLDLRAVPLYALGAVTAVAVALRAHPPLRKRLLILKGRIPGVGGVARDFDTAVTCRNLALLLESGVPLLTALQSLAASGSESMAAALRIAARHIRRGSTLAAGLAASKRFPACVINLVAVAESSGEIGRMLERAGQMLEEAVSHKIDRSLAVLEPTVMLLMGAVVGCVVLATFLPVFQMMSLQ